LHQEKHWFHRFQHIYGFVLYALNYLLWVFYFDFKKYFSGKVGATKLRKYSTSEHIIFWVTKVTYFILFIGLPMYTVGVGATLLGYLILTVVCGMVIAIVFQLAHVVEETTFHDVEINSGKLDIEWAVHQINTSSNFATRSRIVRWYTGGLNHQVEHHLFPRISHVHYPAINKIVIDTCKKFNVQYNEHKTLFQAIRSHVVHLRAMGRA
jgi:linoleoyl-CoA desaturase